MSIKTKKVQRGGMARFKHLVQGVTHPELSKVVKTGDEVVRSVHDVLHMRLSLLYLTLSCFGCVFISTQRCKSRELPRNESDVSTTGTVTTGTGANGQTTGTLYFKIPQSISGGYRYQCTAHAAMVGSLFIKDIASL